MAQVEARSLSAINHIAAHPPQYPINPAERHETLTLYISRVPGCRDIILSTFKPQRKVVTGEDVANSLYYIHMDSPWDEHLAPKARENGGDPRRSFESTMSTDRPRINRKPLPASAKLSGLPEGQDPAGSADATSPTDRVNYPPSGLPGREMEDNMPTLRGGAGPSTDAFAGSNHMPPPPPPAKIPLDPSPISRRPIGPRFMSTGPPSPEREFPSHESTPPPGTMRPAKPPTPEQTRPNLPARPKQPPLRTDHAPPTTFDELDFGQSPTTSHTPDLYSPVTPSRSPSPGKKHKPFTPFSLTLIRRDPGTGHQWNIGKVSSFQSTILVSQDPHNPDAPQIAQYPKGYPAINIHIETSGYARFRNFPTSMPKMSDMPKMSMDSARPGSAGSAMTTMKELAAQMQAQVEQEQQQKQQKDMELAEEGFSRQVVMTYGKTWTHNLKEAFAGKHRRGRSSTDMTTQHETLDPARPPGSHQRQESSNSVTSNDSFIGANDMTVEALHHTGADAEPILTHPGHGLKPKGYTFASPWDGRCDFRTSANGRALTCRHNRQITSQGFNPLVAAQALRDAAAPSTADGAAGGRSGARTRARAASGSLPMGDTNSRVPVSELRFNLPSTDIFNSKEDRERAAEELKQGLSRLLVRSPGGKEYDSKDEDDDEPIFDFSGLGKEKAGGGNRGKRAKLGKLLVHDEGLKMLDLVVAANMGVWWQTWERSF